MQADLPDDGNDQTAEMLWNALVNHRSLFRREVLRLRKELDDFRHFCKEQVSRKSPSLLALFLILLALRPILKKSSVMFDKIDSNSTDS